MAATARTDGPENPVKQNSVPPIRRATVWQRGYPLTDRLDGVSSGNIRIFYDGINNKHLRTGCLLWGEIGFECAVESFDGPHFTDDQ